MLQGATSWPWVQAPRACGFTGSAGASWVSACMSAEGARLAPERLMVDRVAPAAALA